MSDTARPRNRRGEGDRLRQELLDAAREIVEANHQLSPLTLRGVAREARISAPSIYAHFDDVEALADALLAAGFAELDAAVAEAIDAESSGESRLFAACRAYVGFARAHRGLYRFMVSGSGFAPDALVTYQRVEDELRACIASGVSTSTDPHQDAFLLWVGLHGMSTLQKPDRAELRRLGPLDRTALTDELVRRIARLG
jgi:AcrR family transcriptional regulator